MTSANTPKSVQYLHKGKRSGSVSVPNEYTYFNSLSSSSSIRQSPQPITDSSAMPRGAVISPPESPINSSDDEREQKKGGRLENLEELKKAVESISQQRSGSASPDPEKSARKTEQQKQMRHTRSSSEPAFMQQKLSTEDLESRAVSDNEDDVIRIAPPMVRKKSGEIVKSSLKSRRRPKSMPSTPTYPKVVHFDQHLEHVRHFSRSEKPTAVSAGSSPAECYELESEFPFGPAARQPFEWEISLPNFPKDQTARKSLPVRVERVYLSADKQGLMGSIAVANLSFHKSVVVRFTLDYWRTTSEVSAEYNADVRKKQKEDGCDRFNFCIRLDNVADLNNQTLFFCVRYSTNGQEFWDNNNAMNFQVDFSKKMLGSSSKSSSKNSLPRSKPSPKKISIDDDETTDDEFALTFKKPSSSFDRPKLPQKSVSEDSTTLPIRRSAPPTNALGSRYSFGASLNAAIKESTTPVVLRDENRSNLKVQTPTVSRPSAPTQQHSLPVSKVIPQKPALPRMNSNEKPSIESLSYRELLDNYCFFGSAKTSPQNSYTDLAGLREPEKKDQQSSWVSPFSAQSTPSFELGGQSLYRWSPSSSPPSLSGSPHSSVASTPISITGPYNYQRRRHGGGLGGFALEAAPATAIRG